MDYKGKGYDDILEGVARKEVKLYIDSILRLFDLLEGRSYIVDIMKLELLSLLPLRATEFEETLAKYQRRVGNEQALLNIAHYLNFRKHNSTVWLRKRLNELREEAECMRN